MRGTIDGQEEDGELRERGDPLEDVFRDLMRIPSGQLPDPCCA